MAAAASLTIPVSIGTPLQAYDARKILSRVPGASNIAVDAPGGKLTLKFEFPGNIDQVMSRLRDRHVTAAGTLALSIPVVNISGNDIDREKLLTQLNASPAVLRADFDGKAVVATIAAQTNAMRYLYEEIIVAGLMPLDVRTEARPQDFVL